MTDGVPAPGAPAHLDPGATGGLRKSPSARLGGSTESGVSTPPEAETALGEGASPPAPPFPSRRGWGSIGAARPRQQHSDWLGRVTCPPPTATRARPRTLPRVVYGVTGAARPRPVSRDPRPHYGCCLAGSPASRAPEVAPVPPTRLSVRVQHGCHGPKMHRAHA